MQPETRSGTYLVTSVTDERRRTFQKAANAELFIETLQHYRCQGFYKLHAFVVMPDHVYLLLTPSAITLERAVGLIKGGFSHRLKSKYPVWQKEFNDHRCRDADEFISRPEYIHQNPVRAGVVVDAALFRYSSAFRRGHTLSG